ncbi:MAG: HEPN domain-containing protein [Verrucomicrobiia bacterium]|jgi:HEPN domain-containing protein
MKPITREWVAKAEGDFRSAQREVRVARLPNHDLVCFLSQQCVEKYLKARLVEAGVDFPKIHNLVALLKLVAPVEPRLTELRPELAALNPYGVEFRYPGDSASQTDAKSAFACCCMARTVIRHCLGFDEPPSGQMNLRIKERRVRYKVRRKKK